MARILMVTVPSEGGLYSLQKDLAAPIRVYSDRWIEDDIAAAWRRDGRKKRNRLSKNEYRRVRVIAKQNDRYI